MNSFSAEGSEIYYSRALGRDEVWAIPTLGGNPHRLVSGFFSVSSPDGASLFYFKTNDRGIYRTTLASVAEERIYSFDNPPLLPVGILPFPNGKDLLIVTSRYGQIVGATGPQLHRLDTAAHKAAQLGSLTGHSADLSVVTDLAWSEAEKRIVYSMTANGLTNLWAYSRQTKH